MPSFPHTQGGMQPEHQTFESGVKRSSANQWLPEQKRKRCDKENVYEHIPESKSFDFITLAQDISNAIVGRKEVAVVLGHLDKLSDAIASDTTLLNSAIINGTNARDSENDLLDADTMHWMNNFLILQLGYLSSFTNDKNVTGIEGSGSWSAFVSTLMKRMISILFSLHDCNAQRISAGEKVLLEDAINVGYSRGRQIQASMQLLGDEVKECSNIICKVIRRALDKASTLESGSSRTNTMATIRNGVGILCLVQKCSYNAASALKSDETTMNTLVRLTADISGSSDLLQDGITILDETVLLLKALASRTGFEVEQPYSALASVCADIIQLCSPHKMAPISLSTSMNIFDDHYAFLMRHLDQLRSALRSRTDCIHDRWDMLFRSIVIILRSATRNTKLVMAILSCIKYFSSSRYIAPFLSNDKNLVSSIMFTVAVGDGQHDTTIPRENTKDISIEAIKCITLLASKLVTCTGPLVDKGCYNIAEMLLSIASDELSTHVQSEIIKGLRIFTKNHINEIFTSLKRMDESERKEVLQWVIHIPANKKASRSTKEAAVLFMFEVLFAEFIIVGSELYTDILEACQELVQCDDRNCEEALINVLAANSKHFQKLYPLSRDVCLLSTLLDTANDKRRHPTMRQKAMMVLKVVTHDEETVSEIVNMNAFTQCVTKFLSLDNDSVICRQDVLEIIICMAEFPLCAKALCRNNQVMTSILSYASSSDDAVDPTTKTKLKQIIAEQLVSKI